MVADVNEGVGFLMVQLLRTRDHSKDKTVVELALQTLFAYHILKAVENWSSRSQEVEIPRRASILESCQRNIGTTLVSLLKSIETLAVRIREGPRAEYKILCARPGSYFNKDFMQKLGASLVKWNLPSSKKPYPNANASWIKTVRTSSWPVQ